MKKNKLLTNEESGNLFLQLAYMYHAGIGTSDALSLIASEQEEGRGKKILEQMSSGADAGAPLSAVMKETGCFSEYATGLIEVGEKTGRLEESANALSQYYENRVRLDRKIRSALLYPAILLLIMLAVVIVLLVYVLPLFNDVYAQIGSQLTGIAAGLLAFGQVLKTVMPVLLVILALATVFLICFAASDSFRTDILTRWRKRHGDRGISKKMNMARISQALSMGMASGLALDESVQMSKNLVDDSPAFSARCDDCLERYNNGASAAAAVSESGLLPKAEGRLLETGIKGGSGDTAMAEIARRLGEESEADLEEKISRIEPALVIAASIVVGLILLSVMLPLMNIMAAMG